ncbi:MAG: hypothetical protein GYA24_00945 [Candidatus Lokiarchaeota archaeon]|nr:hypothetical protein [Candidatus Lokiarchaeota archaeon]
MARETLDRSIGPVLLACGIAAITLSTVLFASFSIYLSRSVEKAMPWVIDGSSFLYGIAFSFLLVGTGLSIVGFLRHASRSVKLRDWLGKALAGHTGKRDPSMKRAVLVVLWVLPFMTVFSALALQMAIIGNILGRLTGLMTAGFLVLIAGGLLILTRGLLQSVAVRAVFFVIYAAFFAFITFLLWISAYTGYRLVWHGCAWGTGLGLYIVVQDWKGRLQQGRRDRLVTWVAEHFSRRQYTTAASYLAILALFAGPGTVLMTSPYWNCQTMEFTITPAQAQQTDLVMYYTSGFATHHYVVDIARDFNVTLTLAWDPSYYYNSSPGTPGHDMVEFIEYANNLSVPIEMFSTYNGFKWKDLLAGSLNEEVWSHFKSWLATNNITVQYVLWDIEDLSRPSEISSMEYFFPFLEVRGLAQRTRELPDVRAQFEKLVRDTAALGAKTRITTFGPGDVFDGDADVSILAGLANYDLADLIENGSIEYISTMAYTNHWGDIPPDQLGGFESVFRNARQLRRLMPNAVGLDIGNINGAGMNSTGPIVEQVNLAIAGGATSVRLFNGASWVNGWDYTWDGPEWGENGTRALFTAIRQGGTARFTENPGINAGDFMNVFLDCLLNIMKI